MAQTYQVVLDDDVAKRLDRILKDEFMDLDAWITNTVEDYDS